MVKFSIIIPVYNSEKYICQCIESVINQTFSDFELILVDDGSRDNSGNICAEYATKDNRIKVLRKNNAGAHFARKSGLSVASGDYICFIDSDDYIDHRYLETFAHIINKHDPDVAVVDIIRFNDSSQTLLPTKLYDGLYIGEKLINVKKNLIHSNTLQKNDLGVLKFSLCDKCYKNELIKTHFNNLTENIVLGEDMAITMPLVADCQSLYVSHYAGYYYRDNPTSIVNSFRKDDFEKDKILIKYLDEKMPSHFESISFYLVFRMKSYLVTAAKASASFSEFKDLIKNNFSKKEYERVKDVIKKDNNFKQKILFYLLRHKLLIFVWIMARMVK